MRTHTGRRNAISFDKRALIRLNHFYSAQTVKIFHSHVNACSEYESDSICSISYNFRKFIFFTIFFPPSARFYDVVGEWIVVSKTENTLFFIRKFSRSVQPSSRWFPELTHCCAPRDIYRVKGGKRRCSGKFTFFLIYFVRNDYHILSSSSKYEGWRRSWLVESVILSFIDRCFVVPSQIIFTLFNDVNTQSSSCM